MPSTEREWEAIVSKTADRWQSPNCIEACDGKHISLIHPKDIHFNINNVLAMAVFIVTHHYVKLDH